MDTTNATGRVTVVMVSRDRREQVLTSLEHLCALPEQPPIVLVDNDSRDGTAEAVGQRFPAVRVLRPGRNLGATGRTLGVEAAATDYVAFADDDSWWQPRALARAAQVFDEHPRLGLLAARLLVGQQQRLDPVCAAMAASPLGCDADLPGPSVLGFVACGAIVRRSAYLAVGGFSPVVFFFGEETVLAQDLAAAGWGLAYVPEVVAHHHPELAGQRRDRTRLQARNALLSVWLRRPASVALRRTAALVGSRDARLRGAVWDAARRLPAVVTDRRPLPPHVEAAVRQLESSA